MPTNELWSGKKVWLNTRLAAVAYRKKSYHSIVVPSTLARTAVRTGFCEAGGAVGTVGGAAAMVTLVV
ncbi:UDP-N-acetylenolpyruvoylglucosamine reductase [Mycolicibacterium fortuitum subsp. acetamidolyticum]|uniref:UDP-N-acetylenolpyruvoylglucosamine reductase n=1 Tax=Mycolicibacterium fortuitum subsp. acetamidolyticum TaxID=144550 RepID=A0A117IE59_MYCFO|nr:hypothetical protein MFTT_44140 [Mycolicibacterium fortuitum subsp. fortuitum]GAT02168.1 UDP-N-acetylenolpyruvoylglucosamine reductase [Mycolicibacterium fortuitum subsp. acetamidolyticum]